MTNLRSGLGRSSRKGARSERLGIESLEDRRMLSVSAAEQEFIYTLNVARNDPAAYAEANELSVGFTRLSSQPPLAVNDQLSDSAEAVIANPNLTASKAVAAEGYVKHAAGATLQSDISAISKPGDAVSEMLVDAEDGKKRIRTHLLGLNRANNQNREIGVATARDADGVKQWVVHSTREDTTDVFLTGVVFTDKNGDLAYQSGEGLGNVRVAVGDTIVRTNSAGGWSAKVEPQSSYIVSASGGKFDGTTSSVVEVKNQNVAVDFVSGKSNVWVDFERTKGGDLVNGISLADYTVTENVRGGSVGRVKVDADTPVSDFRITADDPRFEIRNGNLQLRASSRVDFEAGSVIPLTLTATDRDFTGLSFAQTINVQVKDVNEKPTGVSLTNVVAVSENVPGQAVGKITVLDPDRSNDFTFTVSDERFQVKNGQLRLRSNQKLDFERESSIRVRVTARDADNPGLSVTQGFDVSVKDINEPAKSLSIANKKSVRENELGASVARMIVNGDPDKASEYRYKVSDDRFTVEDGILKLRPERKLNFEDASSVRVVVTAIDKAKSENRVTRTVNVIVDNVNEGPTQFAVSERRNVTENRAGVKVAKLTIEDQDKGQKYDFRLSDNRFVVDSDGTLRLRNRSSLDFESDNGMELTITAVDANNASVTISRTLVITVNNLPD